MSTAIAIGGPEIITDIARDGHFGWTWNDGEWEGPHDWARNRGAQGTREIAWTGGDTLDVDVPAEISYSQAPGPGPLTISGPQRALDNLEISDGHLRTASTAATAERTSPSS